MLGQREKQIMEAGERRWSAGSDCPLGATEKFLLLYPIKQNGGVQCAAWHQQRRTHLKKEGHNEVGMGGQNDPEEKDYRVLRQTGRGDVGLKTKNT